MGMKADSYQTTSFWECELCGNENPNYALFCQTKSCKVVKGSWECKTCGYQITRVVDLTMPDQVFTCPNCGGERESKKEERN